MADEVDRPPDAVDEGAGVALGPVTGTLASNDFRTLQQLVDKSVSPRRFTVLLLGGFAVFALVLASLGIYALISYSVNQRTQEIGIRMALGAQTQDVLRMVLGHAGALAGIGIAIGAAGAALLTRFMSGMLYDVRPFDAVTFVAVAAILAAVALLAAFVPGRRAARVDPVIALRAE